MTMSIFAKKKELLECSGGLFETLTYTFEEIFEEKRINNSEIREFLKEMLFCSKTMHPFFDLSEYIKTSKGILILISILEEAIKRMKPTLTEWAFERLIQFHKGLIEHYEELKISENKVH